MGINQDIFKGRKLRQEATIPHIISYVLSEMCQLAYRWHETCQLKKLNFINCFLSVEHVKPIV